MKVSERTEVARATSTHLRTRRFVQSCKNLTRNWLLAFVFKLQIRLILLDCVNPGKSNLVSSVNWIIKKATENRVCE